MNQEVCRVRLIDLPFHADKPFDYFIPPSAGRVRIGDLVAVPFGGGNRTSLALVTELREPEGERPLKPIHGAVYPEYALDESTMGLVRFLSEQTLCSYGEAVKAVLPLSAFVHLQDAYYPCEGAVPETDFQTALLEFLKTHPGASEAQIFRGLGERAAQTLKELLRTGKAERRMSAQEHGRKMREEVSLTGDADGLLASPACKRSKKRAAVVSFLAEHGEVGFERLKEEYALTRAQLLTMEELGLLRVRRTDVYRKPYAAVLPDERALTLSEEQRAAKDTLCAMSDTGKACAALLYGVTGSGKTHVIRAVMDHVIAQGKGVILLVPEISLTPQTVQLFSSWFGDRVAVIHSALSAGERFDAWRRIRAGEVDVCIGTRSAVFAPFANLGLIVLDEEQEHTYKSDQNPKYHARDVARYRCAKSDALMLLASATPSVESFYKAQNGKYQLVRLSSRYGQATLPETIMADLRADVQAGNLSILGSRLQKELEQNLQAGEQSILFVNRRGYHNYLSCNQCGAVKRCPHCSVSLTYHTRGRYRAREDESVPAAHARNGYLTCHYCGYRERVPEQCPECGNTRMQFFGFGTQMAENSLQDAYPEARVLRMDADTTQGKFAYEQMLDRFRASEGDILLGTQMVTKGHDFPNVTLVGVLSADASLYLDDYRANERTFSLITQVIGRAGRAAKAGRAVIQTYSPDHAVLRLAAAQDYDGFYRDEIAMRRALVFPPFCDIVLFSFSCAFEPELLRISTLFATTMQKLLESEPYKQVRLQAFGPFEAPIYKKQDQYRLRLVVKCKSGPLTRSMFAELLQKFGREQKKVSIQVDINPSNL